MDAPTRQRIVNALDFWVKAKIEQRTLSEAAGSAQGGTRAAVTGGKHLAGVNRLVLDELESFGLQGVTYAADGRATLPGYYRATKNWDLLVLSEGEPVLAVEYKSMTGSEGKNLNNRADEVLGVGEDLRQAQAHGLVNPELRRAYVFLMEVTPEVQVPVRGAEVRVGHRDPVFDRATYIKRMAILLERMRSTELYDAVWAVGVVRGQETDFIEPRAEVGWDRFSDDLRGVFEALG